MPFSAYANIQGKAGFEETKAEMRMKNGSFVGSASRLNVLHGMIKKSDPSLYPS